MQESNCDEDASSGKAYGVMQITEGSYNYYCGNSGLNFNDVKSNYEKNIKCGVKILGKKYEEFKNGLSSNSGYYSCSDNYPLWAKYSGWDAAIRAYNGWGCDPKSSDIDYVENVNNLAKELNNLG